MKTKTLKQILLITGITMLLLLANTGAAKAALQANPNTQYQKKDKSENWISIFRNMETSGGGMGLNETLKSDLTSSSGNNGIDVHMMKSTEYGAMAILSASGYGNPSNDAEITSTTGNNTGIMVGNVEFVAGGYSGVVFTGVDNRYYDAYGTDISSAKRGDALGDSSTTNPGCTKWHSATQKTWISYVTSRYIKRGQNGGGIFSYSSRF